MSRVYSVDVLILANYHQRAMKHTRGPRWMSVNPRGVVLDLVDNVDSLFVAKK